MGSKPSVYLAGPITGESYGTATDWREYAKRVLTINGIDGFSPMRGKQHLLNALTIEDRYDENVLSNSRSIMRRDHFDVCQRDIVLVNFLEAKKVSIGTVMEMAWAYHLQKPIILVAPKEDPYHEHAMLHESIAYRVTTLDEGLALCRLVLLP